MRSIKLMVSLLLVPRLFANLLLVPLLLSLTLVVGQSWFTQRVLKPQRSQLLGDSTVASRSKVHPLHRLLFGIHEPLGKLEICNHDEQACPVDRFDLVIRPDVFKQYPRSAYIELFEGQFRRLHVCRKCRSEIMIAADVAGVATHLHSLAATALVRLVFFERSRNLLQSSDHAGFDPEELLGARYFYAPGFVRPANIQQIAMSFVLLANVALFIMCALWLALKAHRKVLDYFVGSGALMPLVAATGRGPFYAAIWMLTLLRVVVFLLMGIPVVWVTVGDFLRIGGGGLFYYSSLELMLLWVAAIFSSMGLAMLVASIADLQHRHFLASFLYKLVPLFVAGVGSGLWICTFLSDSVWAIWARYLLAALPISGMGPLLVAPILPPPDVVLIIHAMLSAFLVALVLRRNARWFAVHLDSL